jgi:hypothetical protein
MGFSLKKLEKAIRPITKMAAPYVGYLAGPAVGSALQPMISGYQQGSAAAKAERAALSASSGPAYPGQPFTASAVALPGGTSVGWKGGLDGGMYTEPTAPPGQSGAGALPAVIGGAAALVRMLLARASAFVGARVSRSAAMSLIRKWGPTAAASALGWSAAEVLQFWFATGGGRGGRRRGRGLTYRQIQTANRVARTLHSMTARFRQACSSVGYTRRRSSAPKKGRR